LSVIFQPDEKEVSGRLADATIVRFIKTGAFSLEVTCGLVKTKMVFL
jgi:hypothetical protein